MQNLNIGLLQTPLHWEAPEANRCMLEKKIAACPPADIIVLPEMFTTGFSMNTTQHAEPENGPTVDWMAQQAARRNVAICGSIMTQTGDHYVNRLIWMSPDGHHQHYDKRHLFRYADEHAHYAPGHERLIVHYKGWRLCPLICYDLRFPVFSRNCNDYDALIYIADWPAARRHHWRSLITARAIENISYVVGVNRIGDDGNGLHYSGDSCVIDMSGTTVCDSKNNDGCSVATLSAQALTQWREKYPFHLDADTFSLRNL